ncbi:MULTISPECIES: HTH-type transcriptional activator IlvY [Photobacterium]|uniref:Transcriptional regulator n=1 Tax=Photobacterium ganghwense TaxID=320778 RepID=A0A0J1H2I1_9GAMM|nr:MULTISPECIES: HTH-type transcriptional activator IlvY [Photobacterium]KLV06054.1 transcriptional regulator [Photobacterium ganghwense]MBV1842781.1 HTH-type transcriptional activator IlvY [Photobacterium ganghwense]PSU05013.1 HTH-type transcriptional activator IlvY [Photobacterium ganghwense]QSV14052.1 HTH-type transcriptional activator IlvY [Photobacterium ganghwense]
MNIKTLQLFLHLCESRSFSQTAQAMHISPSALSRIIQRLEEDTGQILFIRDNRSVELTSAAKTLLPTAAQIVTSWQEVKAELGQQEQALQGKLRLFCSVTASYSHLPDILSRFRQLHPQVEIQLLTGDPAQAIDRIQSDDADIAIAAKPDSLPGKLIYLPLDSISMSVIAPLVPPPALQPAFREPPAWNTLPFILPESGMAREKADKWIKSKKIKPNVYAQVSGHEAIVSMVALGCGIGIAPDVVINNSPVGTKVKRLEKEYVQPLQLGLCCKQSRENEPLLHALLALFRHNN